MTVFNIYGKNEKGELKFNLPFHQFKWNDEIAVTRLITEWKSPKEKMFGFIESDLVDLSSTNIKRELISFTKSERTGVTDIQVACPVFYEIQTQQLENVSVAVKPMFDKPLGDINNIYLQLLVKSVY